MSFELARASSLCFAQTPSHSFMVLCRDVGRVHGTTFQATSQPLQRTRVGISKSIKSDARLGIMHSVQKHYANMNPD